IAFQSALMLHPRFASGDLHTGLIAEEFPEGFHPSGTAHREPVLLAAAAAYARRRYIQRAVRTTGRLEGHERRVGDEWVALIQGRKYALTLRLVPGGCDVTHRGEAHALRTGWELGDVLLRGSWDGAPLCLQVERMGLRYRIAHRGTRVDA